MRADHVQMLISIPSKYTVSQVLGFIKGKSAIHLARVYAESTRSLVDHIFRDAAILCRRWRTMKQ
jgi:putative transposase